jgi:hypothetical protein
MWGSLCIISFTFAYFLVPETKGLSLEQVDKMLEESTPRTSNKWKPHSTFAADMHLGDKGIVIGEASAENVEVVGEKAV